MKNIEIITTQNVVLLYEVASLRDRIIAFLLDFLLALIALSIFRVFAAAILGGETGDQIATYISLALFCVYSLVFESLNKGRSLGKVMLKIQVIKLAGGQATFSDYAARWLFRLVDIYLSLGGIAFILITSSAKSQRIGDLIANTAVVKTMSKLTINLDDLLSIHSTGKYVPKYQQARKLQEQDALLIKATLERYRRFQNDAHEEAIIELTTRVQQIMGIGQVPGLKTDFLQTVLKDYVILSR